VSATPRFPTLALRIWSVNVAAVLLSVVGVLTTAHLVATPPPRGPPPGGGPYVVRNLASLWGDEAGLRGEVTRIEREAGLLASVHRWDGTRVAGAGADPLPEKERARLVREGRARTGEFCFPGPCAEVYRLGDPEAPHGYVVLAPMDRRALGGFLPLALTVLGLAVASVLLGVWITRPLQRLAQAARALGAGDLTARTGMKRRDELGQVAQAFDEMAERLVGTLRGQTELIANVAHELRTPLARIRVALDLADDGDAAVARSSLAEIGEDLGELEQLVADVLASARLELAGTTATASGAPPLHLAPVDLAPILATAAERLRHRHPGRRVEVDVPAALPAVEGDGALLRRVVENLLDNARKYSPEAMPIRLAAAVAEGRVTVTVADRGHGIAPEDLARLFTPFFRADRSRARSTGGVGLGLSLSRRIAEAHRGTLTVASEVGVGSTFTLSLPAGAPSPP
jgi:signal transduction histidine kinase